MKVQEQDPRTKNQEPRKKSKIKKTKLKQFSNWKTQEPNPGCNFVNWFDSCVSNLVGICQLIIFIYYTFIGSYSCSNMVLPLARNWVPKKLVLWNCPVIAPSNNSLDSFVTRIVDIATFPEMASSPFLWTSLVPGRDAVSCAILPTLQMES